jgi:acetylornithine/N-succinyldiaminopimelate aminotransferase
VVRLLPPLNIGESHLDEAIEKLMAACAKLDAALDMDAKAAGAKS